MKKIATLTFHWAANYGAVLQAFALQKYLKNNKFETEIIDYIPIRTLIKNLLLAFKKHDFAFFKKCIKFKKFRKNELEISKKKYFNNKNLYSCADKYSAVICGSDQIWNMSFTEHGEGKLTLSYFLNFVGEKTKRIAYATSFGTTKVIEKIATAIKPELDRFSAISVRENSAVDILSSMGVKASTVVDPTLLLKREDYFALLGNKAKPLQADILTYIIHSNQKLANAVNDYVVCKLATTNYVIKDCDIYEWLQRISQSQIVVTNSFHGTVFSLIFHKPFICVAIPGSGMNDRLKTLLEAVGLEKRFVEDFDTAELDSLMSNSIDWELVDCKIEKLRTESKTFLLEALK